jgi:hypothetical protein
MPAATIRMRSGGGGRGAEVEAGGVGYLEREKVEFLSESICGSAISFV